MSTDDIGGATPGPLNVTTPYQASAIRRVRNLLDNPPEQIGPYRILERLGDGGMGEVYRAEQRTPIRREVAIKVIKMGMDTKLVLARFEAERQALALMEHPHIAKVFDASTDETGRPYFVMEYVKGKPITEYADINHLTIEERLELFLQVCHAIQHAHHKGVIHRDVKPSNVLVCTQDGKPLSKVIDFGIAKATSQKLTERTLYTSHDQFIGTPQYMSPEQAEGITDIDTRTDVYSLGVLLYELLTGSTPFGSDLKAAAVDRIKQMIREVDPPKPSTRITAGIQALPTLAMLRRTEPKKLGNIIRGELDWIVMTALDKDRARRYETPATLATDIQRFLDGEPIAAAPPSHIYAMTKFARKYRKPIAVAVGAAVLLCLGLVGTGVGWIQASQALQAANAARDEALTNSYITSISAAQIAMVAENWPEARQRLDSCPQEKRGWEWRFMRARATAPEFGFPEPAFECKLTHSGRFLATSYGPRITLYDLPLRKQIATYVGDVDANWNTKFDLAEDGRMALQNGRSMEIYRGSTEKSTIDFKQFPGGVEWVSFSPHATYVAITVATRAGSAMGNDCIVYGVSDGKLRSKIATGDKAPVFSPDDRLACCTVEAGNAATFLSESGTEQHRFAPADKKAQITAKGFSPDSKLLALGTKAGKVELFDVASGKQLSAVPAGTQQVGTVAFSSDGTRLLTVCGEHACSVWDIATGKSLATLKRACGNMRFTTDNKKIIGFRDGAVWAWADKSDDGTVETQLGAVNAVAFTDDAATTISLDGYRTRVWKTTQRNLRPVEQSIPSRRDPDAMQCVRVGDVDCAFNEWGLAVASVSQATAESGHPLEMQATSVVAPDGRWKAKASLSGPPEVFDESGTRVIAVLRSHEGVVCGMAVTPDGKRLLSGGEDGTVRFWDTDSWTEVATVRHLAAVTGLGLSEDGTRLFVTLSNGVLVAWDARTSQERSSEDRALEHERLSARQNAANLVSSVQPWNTLASNVLADTTYSPLKRIAILYELKDLISDSGNDATELVEKLKQQLKLKDDVQSAIDKMSLSRVQKEKASAELKKWNPTPLEVFIACQQITNDPKETPERWQKVRSILKKQLESEPDRLDLIYTLGDTECRLGNYAKAQELLLTRNYWITNESRVRNWFAHRREMCYLAMAQHHLGKKDDALRSLHTALRFWGEAEPFDALQREAAELIQPAAIEDATVAHSDAYKANDAIDASDLETLKKHVGEAGTRLKGRVIRICPTGRGAGVNVILDSMANGPMVWIRFQHDLDWGIVDAIDGREILVSGTLKEVPADKTNAAWKGRLEIELPSRKALEVIGDQGGPKT